MSTFQLIAVILVAAWLLLVVVFFRRSTWILVAGLVAIAAFTLVGIATGWITWAELGLGKPTSWLLTIFLAFAWLLVMLAYNPLADRQARRWFSEPPHLEAFKPIRGSPSRLIMGILAAWLLGGLLEELVARGIVLNSLRALLSPYLGPFTVVVIPVLVAAIGAGLMHLYQGPRAVAIITQLSVLFGLLFVVSGYSLWSVILCHGLYDTIAFIRFATGKSRDAAQD